MSAVPPPSSTPADLGDGKAGEKTGVPSRRKRRGRAKDDPDLHEVVRRWSTGEATVDELARERGVSHRAIYKFMLSGLGDAKYADVVTDALVARISDADEKLGAAETYVDVSKYSQLGKFARMDFERRRPALYGAKPVQLNVNATVVDKDLADSMQKLLDRVVPQAVAMVPALEAEDADAG